MNWKSCKWKRVVRSSLAGETQAYVETLDMLEFIKVFYALFLGPLEKPERCGINFRETTQEVP